MPFSDIDLVWPEKAPDAILGYALDLSGGELDPDEAIVSVEVSISPSGASDDLIVAAPPGVVPVYVAGGVISVWFEHGIPGRYYLVRFLIKTSNMATHSLLVSLPITRTFAAFPSSEPISTEFTAPVGWTA